jgi:hypothetical protein
MNSSSWEFQIYHQWNSAQAHPNSVTESCKVVAACHIQEMGLSSVSELLIKYVLSQVLVGEPNKK